MSRNSRGRRDACARVVGVGNFRASQKSARLLFTQTFGHRCAFRGSVARWDAPAPYNHYVERSLDRVRVRVHFCLARRLCAGKITVARKNRFALSARFAITADLCTRAVRSHLAGQRVCRECIHGRAGCIFPDAREQHCRPSRRERRTTRADAIVRRERVANLHQIRIARRVARDFRRRTRRHYIVRYWGTRRRIVLGRSRAGLFAEYRAASIRYADALCHDPNVVAYESDNVRRARHIATRGDALALCPARKYLTPEKFALQSLS